MADQAPAGNPLLGKLSAELRNNIYRLALVPPGYVFPVTLRFSKRMALLQTCKQIRAEASSIFYGEVTFVVGFSISSFDSVIQWIQVVPSQHLRHVPKLIFTFGYCIKFFEEVRATWLQGLCELEARYRHLGHVLAKTLVSAGVQDHRVVLRNGIEHGGPTNGALFADALVDTAESYLSRNGRLPRGQRLD